MNILILSFYYPPDLSAGSFRTMALVNSLLKDTEKPVTITVLTTQPSRYSTYSPKASSIENLGAVTVKRIAVVQRGNGIFGQALLFAQYALGVNQAIKGQTYDLVFATSSRMMTATLGSWVARKLGAKLFLDLRDLLVDALPDILPMQLGSPAAWVLRYVERWTVVRAQSVNLASPGFVNYFESKYPGTPFTVHTNGVDDIFIEKAFSLPKPSTAKLNILYAGNIGVGQGLHRIIPELAAQLDDKAQFIVIGCGRAANQLNAALAQHKTTNVKVIEPVKRADLINHYQNADVLFLHLNNLPSLKTVIPSKLFEYAATEKPILGGLSGYSAEFAASNIANIALFEPCDVQSAMKALQKLHIGMTDRTDFISKFSRKNIVRKMANELLHKS
ncbi:glycosyltransferase family 4 protein [Pseudomonas putida]|uniref:glycosyltransferase family 4 protein n=1 Tax=Pseudomonas putida TaxID=303 RepID=UPI002160B4B1|nr:glycosyltransferase family 4 protein [Pseudomonas putida]UVL79876.1 glycosyltransferase family 4 protein [Pseudomonas putida]